MATKKPILGSFWPTRQAVEGQCRPPGHSEAPHGWAKSAWWFQGSLPPPWDSPPRPPSFPPPPPWSVGGARRRLKAPWKASLAEIRATDVAAASLTVCPPPHLQESTVPVGGGGGKPVGPVGWGWGRGSEGCFAQEFRAYLDQYTGTRPQGGGPAFGWRRLGQLVWLFPSFLSLRAPQFLDTEHRFEPPLEFEAEMEQDASIEYKKNLIKLHCAGGTVPNAPEGNFPSAVKSGSQN